MNLLDNAHRPDQSSTLGSELKAKGIEDYQLYYALQTLRRAEVKVPVSTGKRK